MSGWHEVKRTKAHLLDDVTDAGTPPTEAPAELTGAKRRNFWISVSLAIALLFGGATGYLIAGTGSSGRKATSSQASPGGGIRQDVTPLGAGGNRPSPAVSMPDSYSTLFGREANGVKLRVFLDGGSQSLSGATQGCPSGPPLVAEASTSRMVGVSVAWGATDSSLFPSKAVAEAYVLGAAEGDPVAVISVATGPGVARVRATFTAAGNVSDEMAPVYGWAVLTARLPGVVNSANTPIGTVETFGSHGQRLASIPLDVRGPVVAWFGYAPSCILTAPSG